MEASPKFPIHFLKIYRKTWAHQGRRVPSVAGAKRHAVGGEGGPSGARQPGPSPLGGRACASLGSATHADVDAVAGQGGCDPGAPYHAWGRPRLRVWGSGSRGPRGGGRPRPGRSEEHTSELQSL